MENKSVMYGTLERLYSEGRLTEVGLNNAVGKGWITEEEKNTILGVVETVE